LEADASIGTNGANALLGTHKTGSDHETFDDDPGLAPLGFP